MEWFNFLANRKDYQADGIPIGADGMKHIDYKLKKTAGYFGCIFVLCKENSDCGDADLCGCLWTDNRKHSL